MTQPDVWLRGPVPGVPPALQPAAHGLLQAVEDVDRVVGQIGADELWRRRGAAASPGFHLKHLIGATDRLLSYGAGEPLTAAQRGWLALEAKDGEPAGIGAGELAARFRAVVELALTRFRETPAAALGEVRRIGKAELPTTTLGCWAHAAEHAVRHAGQLITTLKTLGAT